MSKEREELMTGEANKLCQNDNALTPVCPPECFPLPLTHQRTTTHDCLLVLKVDKCEVPPRNLEISSAESSTSKMCAQK